MASDHSIAKVKPWLHKASGLWCIKRKGKRYWLRHTFRTISDETGNETAIRWIMSHTDDRIDRRYIHNAPVERVRKVTDQVRVWLLGLVVVAPLAVVAVIGWGSTMGEPLVERSNKEIQRH